MYNHKKMGDFWDTNQTLRFRGQNPTSRQDTPGAEPSPECFAYDDA